ncbi:MAG: hypothetical protein KC653_00890, partial [Candidatus Andersenbacteria bacterium]|nr:hypothetical protein [Candidatus Andersenbacteria bacterium]
MRSTTTRLTKEELRSANPGRRRLWYQLILLAVLLVATAARLWHLDAYLHFANDEARDARVVMTMLEEVDPVLVGPSASIGNFSLGPLFYYLEAPFFFVLNGDPLAGGLFAALVGIATVALLFRVGRRLFGRV